MIDIRTPCLALQDKFGEAPELAIVLGSGLGLLAESVEGARMVPYTEVAGWPMSTVAGHAGELVVGRLAGRRVAVMRGRWHLYEGYDAAQITIGVRSLARWGVKSLVLTNAAGGISGAFRPGDLMLITDQINMTGTSPLSGTPAFIDMSNAYDVPYRLAAIGAAQESGVDLKPGVYAGVAGPQYETVAEVRMLAAVGADAVGMSTVLEVIAARHAGMRVLGLSCITNLAAGGAHLGSPVAQVDHAEVLRIGHEAGAKFSTLVRAILPTLKT